MVLLLWVVENRPSPLLWLLTYTTACTTVQAVIQYIYTIHTSQLQYGVLSALHDSHHRIPPESGFTSSQIVLVSTSHAICCYTTLAKFVNPKMLWNFHVDCDNLLICFQPKLNLVHFSLKIWHLVATILIIFLRINWPNLVHFKQ